MLPDWMIFLIGWMVGTVIGCYVGHSEGSSKVDAVRRAKDRYIAECVILDANLREYGAHKLGCAWLVNEPCSCGFTLLIQRRRPE